MEEGPQTAAYLPERGARAALARWKQSLLSRLDCSPALFPLQTAIRGHRELAVGADTELVIEGFPRSGNTFAVAAFRVAQPRPVILAHHLHAPAQILRAAAGGIPCLVLIRRPADAVTSRLIRRRSQTPQASLRDWLRFYDTVRPVLDRTVVASFEQVTSDFGAVIGRINRKFGTGFVPFVHGEETERQVFARIEEMERAQSADGTVRETHVARPSGDREALQHDVRALFLSPPVAALRAAADALYEEIAPLTKSSGAPASGDGEGTKRP